MDIQYSSEFSVEFYSAFFEKKYNFIQKMKFYKTKIDALNDSDPISVQENKKIGMLFRGSKTYKAKLYMDGLGALTDSRVIKDEDDNYENLYITPSDKEFILHENGYYPIIPGTYLVRVNIKHMNYYGIFKVKNKHLNEDEADKIKYELEKEANGLAFELIRRNLTLGDDEILKDLPIKLLKFLIIKKNFSAIMSSLLDLRVRVNYKIIKKYKIINKDKVKIIDKNTIKAELTNNIKTGYMKVPVKYIDYDLPENKMLKKIINYINMELDNFMVLVENSIEERKVKIKQQNYYSKKNINVANEMKLEVGVLPYLNEIKDIAKKMRNSINILKSTEWFNLVTMKEEMVTPHVMFQDSRYNIIYKLYNALKKDEFSVELDSNYAFQMKRTDKLYEMWCYIKICKIIKDMLKFNVIGGWLFDVDNSSDKLIVPELKADTRVKFQRDDISMNFIYDSQIPRKEKDTSKLLKPLYCIRKSNRPDGRLDVYHKNKYMGSIIFEFKYRDRKYLWDSKTLIKEQLLDYVSGCKSRYCHNKYGDVEERLEPISKVFALCPVSMNSNLNIETIEDYYLTIINLKPDNNIDLLTGELDSAINNLKITESR